ncbi:hypothetical protein [Methylobacterium nigriterrae]|uniref:hypothetical protein n=1 Tax=Methylobacterium nigriterrae TaxID=3127512 RepID=UPI003013F8E7
MTNIDSVLETTMAALPPSPRARGEGRVDLVVGAASAQGGEGASTDAPPATPLHPRLPPRFADDEVGKALFPQAGRGGEPA